MHRWFHPEFETDLIDAARYYQSQRPKLGGEFLDEAERAVEEIMRAPERWPARLGGVRRYLIPRSRSDAARPSFSEFDEMQKLVRRRAGQIKCK